MKSFTILYIALLTGISPMTQMYAQKISGEVRDADGRPLAGVNVIVPALQRGAATDTAGVFTIEKLPAGVFVVEFSMIGFQRETRQVDTRRGDVYLRISMHISPLDFPSIVLTAKPQPTDILNTPQSVTVLEGRQLDRRRGQSVMQAIEGSAGVATYTTGSGIVKPAVRGLTSQRVLVVVDGIRQEGQQWSDEHGPEVDAFGTARIEVIRGPNSVLYGSDALGGVISIRSAEVPGEHVGPFRGKLMLSGFSNNRQGAAALSVYGNPVSGLSYRAGMSGRKAGDISTPAGRLFNSGTSEYAGNVNVALHRARGSFVLRASRIAQRLEIHENPAENPQATPYQRVLHDKIHMSARLPMSKLRLEADLAWQRNHRREFEAADAGAPELELLLNTGTVDVKAHHYPIGPLFGTVGFSYMLQGNETLAEEVLIPAFTQRNFALFLFEELSLNRLSLSAGLRVDRRLLEIGRDNGLGLPEQERTYQEVSGLFGLVWRFAGPVALAVNIGRAWRAPTAFELFVDGVHEGTVRYETGDPELQPEQALNTDVSLRYAAAGVQAELALFRNRIARYIYLNPTGDIDPESGFRMYQHTQADAVLKGAELRLKKRLGDRLVLTAGADWVYGERSDTGAPLPLVPANRVKFGVQMNGEKLLRFNRPYVLIQAKHVLAQNRVAEYETSTAGYTVVRLSAGAGLPLRGGREAVLDIIVENALNTAYRDHLNRYKEYALDPGRNVMLKLALPFGP